MTAQKTAPSSALETPTPARKGWIPKTPVAIVLEQINKQLKKVEGMRAELAREEKELGKLEAARKVLQAQ